MTTQVNLGKIWAVSGAVTPVTDLKYAEGWVSEIPTFQNFNFVLQNYDKNLLALAERGIFDWQSNIDYEVGAKVLVAGQKYVCITDNTNQNPTTDTVGNYWVLGETWGTGTINKGGMVLYDLEQKNSNKWTANDLTVVSNDSALISLQNRNWNSNVLLGNINGYLAVVRTNNAYTPDGRDITPSAGNAHYVYHEGHPPIQSEVAGTIPANPVDGIMYGRRDGNWIQVSSTTIAEHPPQPVNGNGAGWYNLQDGNLYLDIDDGDSSQWVPANPIPLPESDTPHFTGDMTITTETPKVTMTDTGLASIDYTFDFVGTYFGVPDTSVYEFHLHNNNIELINKTDTFGGDSTFKIGVSGIFGSNAIAFNGNDSGRVYAGRATMETDFVTGVGYGMTLGTSDSLNSAISDKMIKMDTLKRTTIYNKNVAAIETQDDGTKITGQVRATATAPVLASDLTRKDFVEAEVAGAFSAGISGTFANPTSITVVNGLIVSIS